MANQNENIREEYNNDDNLDLLKLIEFFLRNKIFISSFTFISTFLSILLTFLLTPIYEGKFQIVVDKKNTTNDSEKLVNNFLGNTSSSNKTVEFILKSPSVLKPVYNYVKSNYKKRGQAITKLTFEKWRDNNLNIGFEKGTNVVTINFKDKDKELILKTLKLISNEYQNYSKKEREKFLSNAKEFLTKQQAEIGEKSKISLKKLNKFSIENGLGDIDGFVSLGQQSKGFNVNNLNSNELKNLINSGNNNNMSDFLSSNNLSLNKGNRRSSGAGQRFKNQFAILESYETEYLNASAKLKPNSKYLKELQVKINNLRETLKRPNEILLKYRELTTQAERDENLLYDIEYELVLTNIEIARQKEPWQLISEPTVGGKIFPSKFIFGIFGLIFSFILSSIFSKYIEKRSGKIYDFEELKKFINCLYLETIFINNKIITRKLIQNVVERYSNKNKYKIGLINYSKNNSDFFRSMFNKNENIRIFQIEDEDGINDSDFLGFIINKEDFKRADFILLNKYINIYNEKIIGWFYLDSTTVI